MNKAKFEKQYPHLKIADNSKINAKEKEEVKSLIRLGDNARLAILTVKANRQTKEQQAFYYHAYCI